MTVPTGAARCAPMSRSFGEPLAGSAPEARAWLAIEQEGPWGRQALTESHLGEELGNAIAFHAHNTGVKPLLIRRPGKHADDHHRPTRRTIWLAHSMPGATWMRRLEVDDPRELLDLDLVAAGQGVEPDVGVRDDDPLLLVCTNSKRDQCCAFEGRPLAHDVAARHPGRVWECSHLGGHRFSPTALLLPHGLVHGRLDGASADGAMTDATHGRLGLATLRGRSCWTGAEQSAEIHVRRERDLEGLADVVAVASRPVESKHDPVPVGVTLADGSTVEVVVRSVTHEDQLRPESCVKPAVPLRAYEVENVTR